LITRSISLLISDADLDASLTIYEIKEKLERECQRLASIREEKLARISSLKLREGQLCRELDFELFPISAERVPTDRDLGEMEARVAFLEREREIRGRAVGEARARVLELWSELGETASTDFEKSLQDKTMRLSVANVKMAKELAESLSTLVTERTRSLEVLTQELEYLWRRLACEFCHTATFREQNFGIKTAQLEAVSDFSKSIMLSG
jgi:hypothetical protein